MQMLDRRGFTRSFTADFEIGLQIWYCLERKDMGFQILCVKAQGVKRRVRFK